MRTKECPKCEADISDSYEPDDRSVGIVGGWYCESCDLAVGEDYAPFDDDVDIFASHRAPISESAPDHTRCPEHPDIVLEMGYDMAGGGMGPYSYCPLCGRIIHKTQDTE